jgi:hypothetical protein
MSESENAVGFIRTSWSEDVGRLLREGKGGGYQLAGCNACFLYFGL